MATDVIARPAGPVVVLARRRIAKRFNRVQAIAQLVEHLHGMQGSGVRVSLAPLGFYQVEHPGRAKLEQTSSSDFFCLTPFVRTAGLNSAGSANTRWSFQRQM